MVRYGVAVEILTEVDFDERTIITKDDEGKEWSYRISEGIKLDEDWVREHIGEKVRIRYKETNGELEVIKIEGIDEYKGQNLLIHFQNENLVAIKDGKVIASVPDLITLLDLETAMPITTEAVKYGYRCFVIGIPCSEMWRTKEGLEVAGPRYFGYDVEYRPIEKIMEEIK